MPGLENKKEAFVTLATNSKYGLGAAVLGYKLRSFSTSRTTVVMVTESVLQTTRDMLSKTWDVVLDVTQLDSNDAERLAMMKRPELGITFSKLNVWKLTQYAKVVFVDADTMPLTNIDDLFQYDELSACRDAGWPDCFNTGLFVLKPSMETYNDLVKRASDDGSFDGGDQGLLNVHFNTWSCGTTDKHIPFVYNVNPNASYTYLPAYNYFVKQVKMVHFLGAVKPWHHQFADGKVVSGKNMTDHTRKYLEDWNEVANIVRPDYSTTTTATTTTPGSVQKSPAPGQPVMITPSAPLYVPPVSGSREEAQREDQAPGSVGNVLTHISTQIKDKEVQNKEGKNKNVWAKSSVNQSS